MRSEVSAIRIAVTCAGDPADVASYSGTPSALLKGLSEAGAQALAVRGELGPQAQIWFERMLVALALRPADLLNPRGLRARRRELRITRGMTMSVPVVRRWGARRGLARVAPVDGVVQYGTAFDLPATSAYVTVEDATLKQVVEDFPWPWIGDPGPALLAKLYAHAARRYERATACAFMSHWAAKSAIEDYGVSPEKVHVVGAGRNHVPPCPDRDWSQPRALFVGRDWERKNGPAVLRGFARLREQWPDACLDVVGEHPSLAGIPGVHAHGALSLTDTRERAQFEKLFARATFFVMPSLYEPAGIVYAEAQAAGLASIATTSGGSRTIVGDAGLVVDPHDDEAIASAMRELADPTTAARMGARALAPCPRFTWLAVAERLLRALQLPGVNVEQLEPFLSQEPHAGGDGR